VRELAPAFLTSSAYPFTQTFRHSRELQTKEKRRPFEAQDKQAAALHQVPLFSVFRIRLFFRLLHFSIFQFLFQDKNDARQISERQTPLDAI
jgi:hypothetical protein